MDDKRRINGRGGNVNARSDALRERVLTLCPQWDASGLSGFLYLEGGYSNHNYRFDYAGDRYVLRAPFRSRPLADAATESRIYDAMAGHLVPEVVALDSRTGDMISRWVEGALLADLHVAATSLADHIRHLHALLPAVERRYDPLAHARGHLQTAGAPAWIEALAQRLEWSPGHAVTCHNDLNPWNLIRTDRGAWVTLDWEWAGANDPLFDIVNLHQGAGLAAAALPRMARRYLGETPARQRLERCLVALWLRETSWALAEIAAGNDRPEIIEQRERGLARLAEMAG